MRRFRLDDVTHAPLARIQKELKQKLHRCTERYC